MTDPDPIGDAQRRKRRTRVVPDETVCAVCGENRLQALERHHIAGVANDRRLRVWVCKNCHLDQTMGQPGAGVELLAVDEERRMPDRLVSVLRGLALLCDGLTRALIVWADLLAAFLSELDEEFPEWRDLKTSKGRSDLST